MKLGSGVPARYPMGACETVRPVRYTPRVTNPPAPLGTPTPIDIHTELLKNHQTGKVDVGLRVTAGPISTLLVLPIAAFQEFADALPNLAKESIGAAEREMLGLVLPTQGETRALTK